MCDPRTAARASLSTMAAGALVSAAGTFSDTLSRRRAARASAAFAEQRAREIRQAGAEEEAAHLRRVGQLRGRQRAALAAAGLDLTEGSPLEILLGTELMSEIDARTIRENAEREAFAAEMDAFNFRTQAAAANPFLAGVGSLLTSAPLVADRWYQLRRSGALQRPKNRQRRR